LPDQRLAGILQGEFAVVTVSPVCGSGPPIPVPLGPTFQPVGESILIPDGVLCPPVFPSIAALLLAAFCGKIDFALV
jgi:hypothetical protein